MYESEKETLLEDKALKKYRDVRVWWYVILAIFVGIFCTQVYREVTRKRTQVTLEAFVEDARIEESPVEESVGVARGGVKYDYVENLKPKRGGLNYDYVENLKPQPKKEEKVGTEGMVVNQVAGIKYGYVPQNGPIPTPPPKQNEIPGIKYRYAPNDEPEKSVRESQPEKRSVSSDSGTFQMKAEPSQESSQSSDSGTFQMVAEDSSENQQQNSVVKPQRAVGGKMDHIDVGSDDIFKSLLNDVDETDKQFGSDTASSISLFEGMDKAESQLQSPHHKSDAEIEKEMEEEDRKPLPDDEAYAIPADKLTHDDFNIVPDELAGEASVNVQPPHILAKPVQQATRLLEPQQEAPKKQGDWRSDLMNTDTSVNRFSWGNSDSGEEKLSRDDSNQIVSEHNDWRKQLLNDDFSDFQV